MKGMRLNDPESAGKTRWTALEVIRQLLLHAPPDDREPRHVITLYSDLARSRMAPTAYLVGTASGPEQERELVPAIVSKVVASRQLGQPILENAPDTVRVLGVADVYGFNNFEAELRGGSGALIDKGCLVDVLFTDLSTAQFLFHEDGRVTWFGASAELGFVEEYVHLSPVDKSAIDPRKLGLELDPDPEYDRHTELGLVIAALTATDDELPLL